MEKMTGKKGLVAVLDALLAYSVMFLFAGSIVLISMNTDYSSSKTTLTLNYWAEDLAEVIGMSFLNVSDPSGDPTPRSIPWCNDTSDDIKADLKNALGNIADINNIVIDVNISHAIDGGATEGKTWLNWTFPRGACFSDCEEIVVAERYMLEVDDDPSSSDYGEPTGDIAKLRIKLGREC
jgi:hypothetical protein